MRAVLQRTFTQKPQVPRSDVTMLITKDAKVVPDRRNSMNHAGASPGQSVRTVVTVVHSPACHFCDDAQTVLAALAETYPLMSERVDIRSPQGQELLRVHRPAMSPLVLVDGEFFSFGRLPRRRLVKLLDARMADAAGTRDSQAG